MQPTNTLFLSRLLELVPAFTETEMITLDFIRHDMTHQRKWCHFHQTKSRNELTHSHWACSVWTRLCDPAHGPELDFFAVYGFVWYRDLIFHLKPLLLHRSSYTSAEVVVIPLWLRCRVQTAHTPAFDCYRSEAALAAPGTDLIATFSTCRDEYGSLWAAASWVFRAHHGGSEGNGGAGAMLPTAVIIKWELGGDGFWCRMMITLPKRVINIMKSYWGCVVVCDE